MHSAPVKAPQDKEAGMCMEKMTVDYGRPAKVILPIHTPVPNIEPLRKWLIQVIELCQAVLDLTNGLS